MNDPIAAIARRLNLPRPAVTAPDVGYDGRRNAITFTIRNASGTVVDIRRRGLGPKSKPMSTTGCKLGLWRHERLAQTKHGDVVYLVEGESDCLALTWLLSVLKEPGVVVAVPGAGTLKAEVAASFKGRKVRILFDNDAPGREGASRAVGLLRAAGAQEVSVWKQG